MERNHIAYTAPNYHQQANPVERRGREIKKILRTKVAENPSRTHHVMAKAHQSSRGNFAHTWTGPHRVVAVKGDNVYTVEKDCLYTPIHADHLRPAPPARAPPGDDQLPPTDAPPRGHPPSSQRPLPEQPLPRPPLPRQPSPEQSLPGPSSQGPTAVPEQASPIQPPPEGQPPPKLHPLVYIPSTDIPVSVTAPSDSPISAVTSPTRKRRIHGQTMTYSIRPHRKQSARQINLP